MKKLMIFSVAGGMASLLATAQAAAPGAAATWDSTTVAPVTVTAPTDVTRGLPDQVRALQGEVRQLSADLATLKQRSQNQVEADSAYQQDAPRGD